MSPNGAPHSWAADTTHIQQLEDGCRQLGLAVNPSQLDLWLQYLALFHKWNRAYNLSAVRDPDEMISRHLLDSLSIAPYLQGEHWIDVGTGGGLPGIPLAIYFPQWHFTLLDSNGKKTRFLFHVKTALGLTNVTVVQGRVETYRPAEGFDGVISRAFASLATLVEQCEHLLKSGGCFWAMKGQYPTNELSEIQKPYKVSANYPLQVPGTSGERHLLVLTPETGTTS